MGKLDRKIALIIGESEGIGRATAQEFVAEGAYVFITGRRNELLDAVIKQIGKKMLLQFKPFI
jgi:NAD(P)-dependent dehydrogenase (short-subunit alcohol dehydrogenase family)